MSKIASQMLIGSDELRKRAQTSYFYWLCHLVQMDGHEGKEYFILANILHNVEFYSPIPLDSNREADGVRLRSTWLDVMNEEADALGVGRPLYPLDCLDGPCSVLEMLVALAMRLEADIMQDDNLGPRADKWFWEMLENLKLVDGLDDNHISDEGYVKHQLRIFLDRKYKRDGRGGLFPLRQPPQDQTKAEIWWQAQWWIREKYHDT